MHVKCKANNIFHRDIKLENFLFTDDSTQSDIKLIDFGFSKEYDTPGKVFHQFVGTCYYLAPEVFKRNYGMEADLWSIAVVFFMMLTGEVPFNGGSQDAIMETIQRFGANQHATKKHLIRKMHDGNVSSEAQSFLLAFFKVIPGERVTASEALANEWLNSPTAGDSPMKMTSAVPEASNLENLVNFKKKSALQRTAMMAMSMSM